MVQLPRVFLNSLLAALFLLICGCAAPASATPSPTEFQPTLTPSSQETTPSPTAIRPTLTPSPEATSTAEPTAFHAEVNPATSATLWPVEIQARFKAVLTDPWTATADQKAAFDTFLTTQWQLTLKDAGVANAETLQGYDLLNAIVDHQPAIVLTGSETPEQLASYVVELPFSLHKLLRTDQDNLVGFHHEDGRYVEGKIDPRTGTDWGKYYANYGLGGTESPKPDHAELVRDANMWSNANNFGFQFYGEKISAATDFVSIEGDTMFLFRIPGTDPSAAVGMMVRMYDGPQTRYAEAFLSLSNVTTTQSDTCIIPRVGVGMVTAPCPAGPSRSVVQMEDAFTRPQVVGTLYYLLKLMSLYKNPHISLNTVVYIEGARWTWKDGIPVVGLISTPNLPKDFFNK
jgi:hypothetical protein